MSWVSDELFDNLWRDIVGVSPEKKESKPEMKAPEKVVMRDDQGCDQCCPLDAEQHFKSGIVVMDGKITITPGKIVIEGGTVKIPITAVELEEDLNVVFDNSEPTPEVEDQHLEIDDTLTAYREILRDYKQKMVSKIEDPVTQQLFMHSESEEISDVKLPSLDFAKTFDFSQYSDIPTTYTIAIVATPGLHEMINEPIGEFIDMTNVTNPPSMFRLLNHHTGIVKQVAMLNFGHGNKSVVDYDATIMISDCDDRKLRECVDPEYFSKPFMIHHIFGESPNDSMFTSQSVNEMIRYLILKTGTK
jgi:hypothetical protein